jgi:hypothetical protein
MTATAKENKIPLRAALYLETVPAIAEGWGTMDLDKAYSSGCERMLKNIFREVVLIKQVKKQEFDVLVKPRIFRWDRSAVGTRFWVYMDVVWVVLSPEGKTIYSNAVKNAIEHNVSALSTSETKVNDIMTGYVMALNDQLLQAQDDLYSSKWWTRQPHK